MVLFLFPEQDAGAIWLINKLAPIFSPVEVLCISDQNLLKHTSVEVSLSASGEDNFNLIHKGVTVNSSAITHCFNTISHLPVHLFTHAGEKDREYFQQEWCSVLLCMLTIMGDKMVFNPAKPFAFTGLHYSNLAVLRKMQQTGAYAAPYQYESISGRCSVPHFSADALVFDMILYEGICYADERITSCIPSLLKQNLFELLKELELKLLMFSLVFERKQFSLLKVYDHIDYRVGGEAFIKVLSQKIIIQNQD